MAKRTWPLTAFAIISSLGIISLGIFFYYCRTADATSKLGSIGSYLSGAGIFVLVIQLIFQLKSYAAQIENEQYVRIWNVSKMIDEILLDFTNYKNNRERLGNAFEAEDSAEKAQSKLSEMELENNALRRKLGNRITSLATLAVIGYAHKELIKQCKVVLPELKSEFERHKLPINAVEILIEMTK